MDAPITRDTRKFELRDGKGNVIEDNLMILKDLQGYKSVGLLDFQDAVWGPIAYDLVSLLEDARRDVPPALAAAMIARYLAAFPDIDPDKFAAAYAILGAQRNAKIVGIFTPVRVAEHHEMEGLDTSVHGETARFHKRS